MPKEKPSSSTSSPAEVAAAAPKAVQITTAFHHSGPLPDPRTLEYYERVCPGAAREIIDMAKIEQSTRHRNEWRNWLANLTGQIFGFVICMTGLCGGIFLLSSGMSITGLSVFIASLGSLVGVAVWNKPTNKPTAKSESHRDSDPTPS